MTNLKITKMASDIRNTCGKYELTNKWYNNVTKVVSKQEYKDYTQYEIAEALEISKLTKKEFLRKVREAI